MGQNRKECHCISSYSKTSGPQHYSAYLLQGRNTASGLGAGRREEVMVLVGRVCKGSVSSLWEGSLKQINRDLGQASSQGWQEVLKS